MTRRTRLVVSIHDVSPATAEQTRRWCDDADTLGIPVSLLVIPGPWRGMSLSDTPDYARVLTDRVRRGDEIVLHGWTHRAGPEGGAARRAVGRLGLQRVELGAGGSVLVLRVDGADGSRRDRRASRLGPRRVGGAARRQAEEEEGTHHRSLARVV